MRPTTQPISWLGFRAGEARKRRPLAQSEDRLALLAVLDHMPPQLLGDERHEGMQELQALVEHPGGAGARLGLGLLVVAGEDRLDQLEIPVAEDAPDELVDGGGRLVELVGFDAGGHGAGGALGLPSDPAVQRVAHALGIEVALAHAFVHLGEARRVPELGGEVAVALDALRRELDVAALGGHGGEREAQRIRPVLIDEAQGVHDVPLGLAHLLAALVAHERMDVDVAERHLVHEVQAHHHHARDPEEDDVEAGDEDARRIVAGKLGRLVGPAQGRERPQRGREPGVEHVLVARQRQLSAHALVRVN